MGSGLKKAEAGTLPAEERGKAESKWACGGENTKITKIPKIPTSKWSQGKYRNTKRKLILISPKLKKCQCFSQRAKEAGKKVEEQIFW